MAAEQTANEVSFGTFTLHEVLDLYRVDSTDLEFGWQEKRLHCLQNSLVVTPEKLTPRSYILGGASPNLPKNPPTTPVTQSRGVSPNPTLPSRLNANAPPFVPISTPEPSNSEYETLSMEYRQALENEREPVGTSLGECPLATPTVPSSESEFSEGGSTPIQTVGVPTPPLPSMTGAHQPSDDGERDGREVHLAAAPPPPSVCSSSSDTARSPITPLNSPPATCHQPHQTHLTTGTASVEITASTTHADPQGHSSTSTTSTNVTASTGSKPKTWASIVSKSGSGSNIVATPLATPTPTAEVKSDAVKMEEREEEKGEGEGEVRESDEKEEDGEESIPSAHLRSLGEQLARLNVAHSSISLQPRGLINQGNWCYLHAPLQALISVPEVCHLLRQLNPDPPLSLTPSDTPLTDTLTQFIRQFVEYQSPISPAPTKASGGKKKRTAADIACGAPFRPDSVYDLLHKIHTPLSTKGKQEDAEEFLCCMLGGLHEEMVAAQNAVGRERGGEEGEGEGELGEGGEDGEWEQVGPKNKSTVTRQMMFRESPVSSVFGGELRSVLQRQGVKESATVEPFFSLQLDIQAKEVWSVQDALVGLATREAVQMNCGTLNEVDAHRRQSLARLPGILVLHLKRFLFDKTGGSQKLMKHVSYKMELEVGRDLLAPNIRNKLTAVQRTYKLWSVVYHHGKSAVGGHYTCDVRHSGSGGWLRFDDSLVKPVPDEAILWQSQASNKVAYLLFYRRLDYVRTT